MMDGGFMGCLGQSQNLKTASDLIAAAADIGGKRFIAAGTQA